MPVLTRLATAFSRLGAPAARRRPAPHVHFHRGPQAAPAPCFDPDCGAPRLDP
jgi:hypothetical protein